MSNNINICTSAMLVDIIIQSCCYHSWYKCMQKISNWRTRATRIQHNIHLTTIITLFFLVSQIMVCFFFFSVQNLLGSDYSKTITVLSPLVTPLIICTRDASVETKGWGEGRLIDIPLKLRRQANWPQRIKDATSTAKLINRHAHIRNSSWRRTLTDEYD